jgi:hypothetical protein
MTTLVRRLCAVTTGWMLAALTACGGGGAATESGSPAPAAAPGTGVVEGVVLASRDSSPIAGATVSSNGRRVGRIYGAESGFFIEADGVSQPLGRAVSRLKAY